MSRFARAYVTGASSGIGAGVASALARDGVEVVLAARRRPELEGVAAAIEREGGRAFVEVLDVADAGAVRDSVRAWDERLGGLDLVLANAGTAGPRGPADLAWESAAQVFATNLLGAAAVLLAALPAMARRGRGTLAAVTSLAGERGMPGSGAYSASKAGLIALLETLRAETAGRGIDVIDVRPGFVRTPMTARYDHPMPFLVELDDAVRRIVRGLERGAPVCAFPAGLALPLVLARLLPARAWGRIAARTHPRGRRNSLP